MKTVRILSAALVSLVVSCGKEKSQEGSSSPKSERATVAVPDYSEVWMMRGWVGLMGVMIGLKEKEYDYYFYSDVNSHDSRTPLTGTYVRNDDGITLMVPKNDSEVLVYDTAWRFVKDGDTLMLASAEDLNAGRDSGRWLRKVDLVAFKKFYDPENPFLLQMNPQLEPQYADQLGETLPQGGAEPAARPEWEIDPIPDESPLPLGKPNLHSP
jgi:hypothetical protein